MLKVIIADDEQRICRLIKALVNWDALNMEIVAMANNGVEALENIIKLKPDILITDIRMPGYDGLELIKKAREINPKLEAIVISGYAQFDYAQTAISYGVGEYLLKPINKEQLNASLAKIKTKLMNENQQNLNNNEALRQKLLFDINTSNFNSENFEAIAQKYKINISESVVQFLMAKIDGEALNTQAMLVIKNKFVEKFESIFKLICTEFEFVCINNAIVGILNYSKDNKYSFRDKLRSFLNELIASKDIYGNVNFTFALSSSFNNANNMEKHFSEMYSIIAERLVEGVGILLEASDLQNNNLHINFKGSYLEDIIMAIDTLNINYAYKALNNIKGIIGENKFRGDEILNIIKKCGSLFIGSLNILADNNTLNNFYEDCDNCSTLQQLYNTLDNLQTSQINKLIDINKNNEQQPIQKAKMYINNNYNKNITLEDVSSFVGFSENYFSTLFKKETGEGFNKYLSKIRVDKARQLLRKTRLSVQEICNEVGYSDIKHFTKTFKGETGLTPSEYRKIY